MNKNYYKSRSNTTHRLLFYVFVATILLLQTSCASVQQRQSLADEIAEPAALQKTEFNTPPFILTGYSRIAKKGMPISIYIEGDGLAWLSRSQISLDPTPTNPIGLRLATIDQSANVLYLARPCQYSKWTKPGPCPLEYWTSHRFSTEVLQSYNRLLDDLKAHYETAGFHLTGFSGGGAIVALLAEQRDDILSLRTVAGNLDHDAINKHHNVDLMPQSLNPADFVEKLQNIPQIHYAGGKDEIVPPQISRNFIQALPTPHCAEQIIIQDASHEKGWDSLWRHAYSNIPHCP